MLQLVLTAPRSGGGKSHGSLCAVGGTGGPGAAPLCLQSRAGLH